MYFSKLVLLWFGMLYQVTILVCYHMDRLKVGKPTNNLGPVGSMLKDPSPKGEQGIAPQIFQMLFSEIYRGLSRRKVGATSTSFQSSRSHVIFSFIVESWNKNKQDLP